MAEWLKVFQLMALMKLLLIVGKPQRGDINIASVSTWALVRH